MSQELREQIDKFKNWGIIKEDDDKDIYNPETYIYDYLDGIGYDSDLEYFKQENGGEEYESAIEIIQSRIDDIRDLEYPLRVYRGLNIKNIDLDSFHEHVSLNVSWTYNPNVAKDFAGTSGIIITGVIEKQNDVNIPYTITRNVLHHMLHEDEIVLKDNRNTKNLRVLSVK